MSKLEAARAARDMLLRKEAATTCIVKKQSLNIKIKEMQHCISLIHKENRES